MTDPKSSPDQADVETYHALCAVRDALTDAYEWVGSLHPSTSRVVRKNKYGHALERISRQVDRAGERICECAAYEYARNGGAGFDGRPAHLSTCPAHLDKSPPRPRSAHE